MFTLLNTTSTLLKIKKSNQIVNKIHTALKNQIKPGITTLELELIALKIMKEEEAEPAFKGYNNYPYSICTSVNDTVLHGFPSLYKLEEGDLISIDVGVLKDGYFGDACFSTIVGRDLNNFKSLKNVAYYCLESAIALCKPGNCVGDISFCIEDTASSYNHHIIDNYSGHAIGKILHDYPQISNKGYCNTGVVLKEGMVICIEPLISKNKTEVYLSDNNWEVKTCNNKVAAHVECCIQITNNYPIILA